jgi:hypothetical protein
MVIETNLGFPPATDSSIAALTELAMKLQWTWITL